MKIQSCCCAFAKGLVEEVHVLKKDCPIKRKEGQRTIENEEQCTCIFTDNIFRKDEISKCQYYNGTKHSKKEGKYYVNCSYN